MTSPWERFAWRGAPMPQAPLEEAQREELELPRTLRPVQSPRAVQQAVFDPALIQHARAYRAADPDFGDTDLDRTWRAARRQALDLVLGAIAGTEHTPLRHAILRAVFVDADPVEAARPLDAADIANLDLGGEWLHFRAEYPDLPDDEHALVARLAAATAPTFAAAEPLGDDPGAG